VKEEEGERVGKRGTDEERGEWNRRDGGKVEGGNGLRREGRLEFGHIEKE